MSIAPIVHTVEVRAAPARAFDLFATRMSDWWPRGKTIGQAPYVAVVAEPHPGGRWYERDAEGRETQWGQVLEWEPPSRLLLAWQIDHNWRFDPALVTEVELSFAPSGDGTLVTLEHRNLERFGADAATFVASLDGGWPSLLQVFQTFTDQQK